MQFIHPAWPAPFNVHSMVTTRMGGISQPPFDSFNLAGHVGDVPEFVAANRALLRKHCPAEPMWLNQVHGNIVALADDIDSLVDADASVSFKPGTVCVVLTADCLPVLFCDRKGTRVAAAHAGWRGLAAGVLEASINAMQCEPCDILAWMGPAIGQKAFEVGDDVRDVFIRDLAESEAAFLPAQPGKWVADIYQLARLRMKRAGVVNVYGDGFCTYTDSKRFFSFRREGKTGRMATLIWRD
ncbi:MAG: peptidoglycan editing factor PgeF [Hydrogenophilaceae bacterium]|nr:peptidoglycan editing factor PgeF [Hydrogenophilaceae bacterium]